MSSEWLKVMLEEIARKQAEARQELLETERRRRDDAAAPPPADPPPPGS